MNEPLPTIEELSEFNPANICTTATSSPPVTVDDILEAVRKLERITNPFRMSPVDAAIVDKWLAMPPETPFLTKPV